MRSSIVRNANLDIQYERKTAFERKFSHIRGGFTQHYDPEADRAACKADIQLQHFARCDDEYHAVLASDYHFWVHFAFTNSLRTFENGSSPSWDTVAG